MRSAQAVSKGAVTYVGLYVALVNFTGWRLQPQVPGAASNTPGMRVPQPAHAPPVFPTGVTFHSLSSYQSRPIVRAAQFGQ